MTYVLKLMTLNINGMKSDTKLYMLENLLWKWGLDMVLLQEVTTQNIKIRGYTTFLNIGTDNRGTAIKIKEGIQAGSIKRMTTGRGIAAYINNMWVINIYAERKIERDQFYNMDIIQLLSTTHDSTILAGDFNCHIQKSECTGTLNYSKALENVIKGLGLIDAWTATHTVWIYTLYKRKCFPDRPNIRNEIITRRKDGD
jgi:exonuclease III